MIGLKPSYGRVSRWGLIAYGSSFDQIGPITRNLQDAALIMEVIAGADAHDSTASDHAVPAYSQLLANMELPEKICVLKETLDHPGLDPEVRAGMQKSIHLLKEKGLVVDSVSFPLFEHLVPAYYVLAMAEASSNLSRYDGIHFGHRSDAGGNASELYYKSRSEGFGTEVKRRIMTGAFVLSAGYYDAYYGKAQKVRRLILEHTRKILEEYPFILLPTAPRPAFPLGTMGEDPVALYLEDVFTTHANLAGIPAISLPLSQTENGLPIGIQVLAGPFREEALLSFSKQLLEFHQVLA
jgi:aspartyl-tRNA(Asn)/glutamyl-tRNA(Gln) amidotransferase subunit A